jgi:hypothetical protein
MDVGAVSEPQREVGLVDPGLEFPHGSANGGAGVFVQSRVNVRGAGDDRDTVFGGDPGHV